MTIRPHLDKSAALYRRLFIAATLIILACAAAVFVRAWLRDQAPRELRSALFDELRPMALANCRFARFGGSSDGGYLLCENLLSGVRSAYSYGINGEDQWGCDVSARYGLPVHQYDCFNTSRPQCPRAGTQFRFNEECIADETREVGGRRFDTLANQIARNGDRNKKLVVKMDVEGAEWESLLRTPDETLREIDQLVLEFHDVGSGLPDKLLLVRRLKETFFVANVHFNNYACKDGLWPFPASAFQVLLVSKRLGVPDPGMRREMFRNPLDAPDNPNGPDCQTNW